MKKKPNQVKQLQGKLGALQARHNDEMRYFLHQANVQREWKAWQRASWQLLHMAIRCMENTTDEGMQLMAEAVKARTDRLDQECGLKLKNLEAEYRKGKTNGAAAGDHSDTPAPPRS